MLLPVQLWISASSPALEVSWPEYKTTHVVVHGSLFLNDYKSRTEDASYINSP